jgi:FKBP-type peptidyl-prolyl cis-trans isomerase
MNNLKQIAYCILVAFTVLLASCCGGKSNYKASLKNDADSASYYLGYYYGASVAQLDFTDGFNLNAMVRGVHEAIQKGKDIDEQKMQELQMFLNDFFMNLQARVSEKALKEGQDFLEQNKKKQGVVTLPSGVQYKIIKDGSGEKPTREDMVDIVYHGTLIDGTVFQSTKESGDTVTLHVGQVVEGFKEALTMMNEGSIWEVYIPSELGYGSANRGGPIKPNSVLIFEIDLVQIKKTE